MKSDRFHTLKLITRFNRGSVSFFVVTTLLLLGDMAAHLLPPAIPASGT